MLGAVFGIILISAMIHLAIAWAGKRVPHIVYFVEDFSGTILIACMFAWVHHMETTERQRPSMFFAYASLYFLFVFVAKLSGNTFYEEVPPRKVKVPLRVEFALFLSALFSVRIFAAITGAPVSADANLPLNLLAVIGVYYLLERMFLKYRQAR